MSLVAVEALTLAGKVRGIWRDHPRAVIGFILALALLCGGIALGVRWMSPKVKQAQDQAAVAGVGTTVAKGQERAAEAVPPIIEAAAARTDHTRAVHEENAHALARSPGADVALDPALNAAGRRGLCQYQVYAADADCSGLREPASPLAP